MKYSELPNKFCCIYKIDFPNNKIYVGRAIDVKRRIWEHYNKKDNTPCQRALKKYYNSYLYSKKRGDDCESLSLSSGENTSRRI